MSFADDLKEAPPGSARRRPCMIGKFVSTWEDRAAFDEALAQVARGFRTLDQVHRILRRQIEHSYATLWRHYAGRCGCPSDG